MGLDINSIKSSWEEALKNVDSGGAKIIAKQAIEAIGLQTFGDDVLTPTLEQIGKSWESGNSSLAEVYMAGRISTEILSEYVEHQQESHSSRVAVAMLDDRHALGKNIVLAALRVAQLPVKDLGTCNSAELAKTVREENIGLLLVSTLMLRSALKVKELVSQLQQEGLNTKVIVGGAPFRLDPDLWQKVHADGVGDDASAAVSIVQSWLEEQV